MLKKVSVALAIATVIGGTTTAVNIPFSGVGASVANAFTSKDFAPVRILPYGTVEFVNLYNKLGKNGDDTMLKNILDKNNMVTSEAGTVHTHFYFETDLLNKEIYAITISGDTKETLKATVLRTMYLIDNTAVTRASVGFEKIAERYENEIELVEGTLYMKLGDKDHGSIKIYGTWR